VDFGFYRGQVPDEPTSRVTIRTRSLALTIRPIIAPYPDYTQFMIDENRVRTTVDLPMLRKALDLVGTVTEKGSSSVLLKLEDEHMLVSAFGYNTGSGEEHVPIVHQELDDDDNWVECEAEYSLRFGYDNLRSVAAQSDRGKFMLSFNPGRQVTFMHEDDDLARYVLMPQ